MLQLQLHPLRLDRFADWCWRERCIALRVVEDTVLGDLITVRATPAAQLFLTALALRLGCFVKEMLAHAAAFRSPAPTIQRAPAMNSAAQPSARAAW